MIKIVLENIKSIDKKIVKIMCIGFKASLLISLLSCYILLLYTTYPFSHVHYLCGLSLFQLGLTCLVSFFICGFTVDKIKI